MGDNSVIVRTCPPSRANSTRRPGRAIGADIGPQVALRRRLLLRVQPFQRPACLARCEARPAFRKALAAQMAVFEARAAA